MTTELGTAAETTTLPIGTRVTAVRGRRRLAGVLLPAAARGGLRVHADDGKVVDISKGPGKWLVAAEQGLAERKADRRRTICPDGRLIYRHGDLPAAQLATMTMLQRGRRRLADGQEPIASYMVYQGYAPLYAVADTVPLPALSPKRQAARDAARTCSRCGGRRGDADQPYTKWHHDGRRYCDACREPAAEDRWNAQRAEGRQAAAKWAAGVLADPDTVLIYSAATMQTSSSSMLRAETTSGAVLISELLLDGPIPRWWPPEHKERVTPIRDVVEQIRALRGRRLVVWRHEWRNDLDKLNKLLLAIGAPDIVLGSAEGDQLGPHWDEWVGEQGHGQRSYYVNQGLRQQPDPTVDNWWRDYPAALLAHMRQALTTMATPDESGADHG